jgi:hypothetical protein
MLYKISAAASAFGKLEPLPFLDAGDLQRREKDLENVLPSNLLDVCLRTRRCSPFRNVSTRLISTHLTGRAIWSSSN